MSKARLVVIGVFLICLGIAVSASIPPPEFVFRVGGSCEFVDGRVIAAGGVTLSDYTDVAGKVYGTNTLGGSAGVGIYDPATNTWSSAKYDGTGPLGFDSDGDGICEWDSDWSKACIWTQTNHGVVYNNKLYVVIGYNRPDGEIYCFDPNAGTRGSWSLVTSNVAWANFRRGVVEINGSTIYLAAGQSSGGSARFGSYDIATDTWTTYMVGAPNVDLCGGAILNGKLYVIGGSDMNTGTVTGAISACDLANPENGWTQVGTLLVPVQCGAVVTHNNEIFILGGRKEDGTATNVVQSYDPSTGTVRNRTAEFVGGVDVSPVMLTANVWAADACMDQSTGTLYIGGGGYGDDVYRPNSINPPWFGVDMDYFLTDGIVAMSVGSIGPDPSNLPYEDWVSEGAYVTGRVLDSSGNGFPNAMVGIKDAPNAAADAVAYATTDGDGYFGPIEVLPTCTYCAAWSPGWAPTGDYTLELTIGETTDQVLQITTLAGKNLSLSEDGRTTLATCDTEDWRGGGITAGNAADGDMGSCWANSHQQQDDESWYIDLDFVGGGTFDINGMTLFWEWARPISYTIDYTTEFPDMFAPWTEIYSTTKGTGYQIPGDAFADAIRFDPVINARGIRIHCTQRNGNNGYTAWEFQIHSEDVYGTLVSGKVRDSGGNPIEGALVHIGPPTRDTSLALNVYTDAAGNYSFPSWKTGFDYLTADAFGYGNEDVIINVINDGSPTVHDFVLQAKSETSIAPNWGFEEADPIDPTMPRYWGKVGDGAPETWTTVWSRTTDNYYEGTASGLLDQTAWVGDWNWSGWTSEPIPVNPDGTVAYNIWLYRRGFDVENHQEGFLNNHYYDFYAADGTWLAGDWYGWYNSPYGGDHSTIWWRNPAEWMTYRAIPPVGAAYMQVGFGNAGWNGGVNAYDNVIIEEVGIATNAIGYTKTLPVGMSVALSGKQITQSNLRLLSTEVGYIEEPDRSSGIRIVNNTDNGGQGVGDMTNLSGTLAETPEGELYIDVSGLDWAGDTRPIDALGMNLRFANTDLAAGLYVKLTGTVTSTGTGTFTITDGSVDGSGAPLETVVNCGTLPVPSVGQTVRVRGVLSTDGTKAVLLMNNEPVDWTLASEAIQPLAFAGPVKALRDYLLIGTFGAPEVDMATQLDTDYIGETTVLPNLGDTVGGNTWFRYDGVEETVNLNRVFTGNTPVCTIYAHVYVYSPIAQNVDIPISTDDSAKVWVNGNLVYTFSGLRDTSGTPYGLDNIANVPLVAGMNRMLVKVVKGEDAGFQLTTQFAIPGTWIYTGDWGWGNSTPMEGLGYLLNNN